MEDLTKAGQDEKWMEVVCDISELFDKM